MPIRLSETCHNFSGQVKCPYMVIRRTSPFFDRNLKLGLLKSRRDSWQCGTSHADTDEDDVSLAGGLQDAVGRRFWAIIHVFFRVGTRVSNLPASCGRSFCRNANRLLGSVLVMFLWVDVGRSEPGCYNKLCE